MTNEEVEPYIGKRVRLKTKVGHPFPKVGEGILRWDEYHAACVAIEGDNGDYSARPFVGAIGAIEVVDG